MSETPRIVAEPSASPAGSGRAWWALGWIVVAIAAVIALVWWAGGFAVRTDLRTDVPVGAAVSTGPYVFTFDRATVQKRKGYSGELQWQITVVGTGRTTGDASVNPNYDDTFAVREPGSGAYQRATGQDFGSEEHPFIGGGDFFTPGLPPIPYRVVTEFPVTDFTPGDTVQLIVSDLVWRDVTLLQSGEKQWASANEFYRYQLPLQHLPDDVD